MSTSGSDNAAELITFDSLLERKNADLRSGGSFTKWFMKAFRMSIASKTQLKTQTEFDGHFITMCFPYN